MFVCLSVCPSVPYKEQTDRQINKQMHSDAIGPIWMKLGRVIPDGPGKVLVLNQKWKFNFLLKIVNYANNCFL